MRQKLYGKYIGKVTCAYKEDIFVDKKGVAFVAAKRTQEREKYLFQGLDKRRLPILIECPPDVLPLEFEGTRIVNEEIIKAVESNLKKMKLEYCIADHGGTSPYIYLWNLGGLPQGYEAQAKKHIALKLVPKKYHSLLDFSNLGKTLIPLIDLPHWKPKYKGAIHKIVRGTEPEKHQNDVSLLLEDFKLPAPKKTFDSDPECRKLKASIRLSSVLQAYGMDISRNPTKCLWHESKSGRNFRFDDSKGLWKCWHCDRGGNVFQFIMIEEKCSFIKAKICAREMATIRRK